MSCSAQLRPTAVKTLRPFQVVVLSGRPRIDDAVGFAAAAVGDLHACDALQGFDDVVVRQLADVLGDDRLDDLRRFALVLQALRQALANAGDDDGFLPRFGGALLACRGSPKWKAPPARTPKKRFISRHVDTPRSATTPGRGCSCPLCYYSDKC